MVASTAADSVRTADGVPLKRKLQRTERKRKLKALALVLPLFLFVAVTFLIPILSMLTNAVYDPDFSVAMPRTVAALETWDGHDLPDEATYAALAGDLKDAHKARTVLAYVGKRLNYDLSGIRSKVIATGRKLEKVENGSYKDTLIGIDKVWGERETWAAIKRAGSRITSSYLLSVLDMEWTVDSQLQWVPANRAIYVAVLMRTLWIGFLVTLATLLLGYPVAYLLATLPVRTSSILMIFVLLPFWTSLLVRTTAWYVLLQDNGVINDTLRYLGLTTDPLKLIFSRFGTVIAMTHIQLPFTLLPIYSVMKTIPQSHVRAARSLGAGPFYAFWRVYFPQTLPGIAAGCLLTFILSLGYYITPALVGGPTDQMVSNFVAVALNTEGNWGKASAFGTILFVVTLVLYFVYDRLIGVDKMKLS